MKKRSSTTALTAGFCLILFGLLLVLCSLPIFNYTIQREQEIQKSQTILNSTFNVSRLEGSLTQVQLGFHQNLTIQAIGNSVFDVALVNFTDPRNTTEPSFTYFSMNNTVSVDRNYTSSYRSGETGTYYLSFLAPYASEDSPAQVSANVTKIWTELQAVSVAAPDPKSLIDPAFRYVGAGLAAIGGSVLLLTTYLKRRNRRHYKSMR